MQLDSKTCIVTGGASGFGLEIVRQLLAENACPIVLDVNAENLEQVAFQFKVPIFNCDVTNEEQIKRVISEITSTHGKIDVLVNNVGILFSSPLVSFSATGLAGHDSSMWEKVLSTNLSSAFYVSKNVVEAMLKKRVKGVIVNISSISANGNAGQSAYAAAKAGLEALTKVWAKELPPLGIRCFGVAPGFCDTESTHAAMTDQNLQQIVARVPLKRLGKPAEVAAFVIAGIKNDYMNGKILEIDGGLVL